MFCYGSSELEQLTAPQHQARDKVEGGNALACSAEMLHRDPGVGQHQGKNTQIATLAASQRA